MNIRNNSDWVEIADSNFRYNVQLNGFNIDYVQYAKENPEKIIGIGFDIEGDGKSYNKIMNNENNRNAVQMLSRNSDIFLFTVSKWNIEYMPNGINQTNIFRWEVTNDISRLIFIIRDFAESNKPID